jgi:hypothetical protein
MTANVHPTEAATALRHQFGPRLEVGHANGLSIMADALRDRFGLSGAAAHRLVEELEQARTIQYLTFLTRCRRRSRAASLRAQG